MTAASPVDLEQRLQEAQLSLTEAARLVSQTTEHAAAWRREIDPLMDQQFPAASDAEQQEQLFDRLAHVVKREREGGEWLQASMRRITALQGEVEERLGQAPMTDLTADQRRSLEEVTAAVAQAEQNWGRDLRQALAVKRRLTGVRYGDTVGEQLSAADDRAAIAELDEQIAGVKRRRAAEQERRDSERRQQQELYAEATSPHIKSLLAPRLAPRRVQPRLAGGAVVFDRVDAQRPMSLAALYGLNVLDESDEGLKRLAKLGGHRKLSPPRWSVNSQPGNWSEGDRQMLEEAQQALRRLGPALVEADLLSE